MVGSLANQNRTWMAWKVNGTEDAESTEGAEGMKDMDGMDGAKGMDGGGEKIRVLC